MNVAVRREDNEVRVISVNEEGHEVTMLGSRRRVGMIRCHLVCVVNRGLVAMVTVRDEKGALGDPFDQRDDRVASCNFGDRVVHAILRGELREQRAGLQRSVQRPARIAVEHEPGAQVRAGRAKELEAILLGPAERALVRQDDALGERHEANEGEETSTRDRLSSTRRQERLVIAVERSLGVAHEDARLRPVTKRLGGVRVLRVSFALRQDETDHVVRVARGELCALGRADDVVGGRDERCEAGGGFREVVAERCERGDVGHGEYRL